MDNKNKIFDEIFNRLLGLGIQSQKELASVLDVSSTSIWNAKKENRFPKKWVSILSQLYNKSPEWILGLEEGPPAQLEVSLVKSLIADMVELKVQINYLEGTVSLLRKEVDMVKLASAKKKQEDYSHQQEKTAKKKQVQQVA